MGLKHIIQDYFQEGKTTLSAVRSYSEPFAPRNCELPFVNTNKVQKRRKYNAGEISPYFPHSILKAWDGHSLSTRTYPLEEMFSAPSPKEDVFRFMSVYPPLNPLYGLEAINLLTELLSQFSATHPLRNFLKLTLASLDFYSPFLGQGTIIKDEQDPDRMAFYSPGKPGEHRDFPYYIGIYVRGERVAQASFGLHPGAIVVGEVSDCDFGHDRRYFALNELCKVAAALRPITVYFPQELLIDAPSGRPALRFVENT